MKYLCALILIGLCASSCGGVKVATGISPVADIANAGGKIQDTGQAILQAVIKAHNASPTTVSQGTEDDVALAVNKLGHGGVTLNATLTAYNAAKAAGSDTSAQKAAVQLALGAVTQFLSDINDAIPTGWLQDVDALVNVVLDVVGQVKLGVGL